MPTVEPVKLICGLIATDSAVLTAAKDALIAPFGAIEAESDVSEFDFTEYYADEMGTGLRRQFVGFADLIDPGRLAAIKRTTGEIERRLGTETDGQFRRRVNLDPGYITAAKLVLATTKDFSHRLYLQDGIYAEVTLNFAKDGIRTFPWTYPDFKSGRYTPYFMAVRRRYMDQVRPSPRAASPTPPC